MKLKFKFVYKDFLYFNLHPYKNGLQLTGNSNFSGYDYYCCLCEMELLKKHAINYYGEECEAK